MALKREKTLPKNFKKAKEPWRGRRDYLNTKTSDRVVQLKTNEDHFRFCLGLVLL